MTRKRQFRLDKLYPRVRRILHPKTGEKVLRGYDQHGVLLGDLPWPNADHLKHWCGRASQEEWDAYVSAMPR